MRPREKSALSDRKFEIDVDFGTNHSNGGRNHRPFVALWIEDVDGLAIGTLMLCVEKTGKGPRWIPDIKRWFQREKERRVLDGGDLAKTQSSATRNYSFCLEEAREHGTYQLIKPSLQVARS